MARRKISIRQEDRIWNLRCQGYRYDEIARITNVHPAQIGTVIYRVIRRPPLDQDPIRRGRKRGFLDESQVLDIRRRRRLGESCQAIARDYAISSASISLIARGISYPEISERQGHSYPFSFCNRLTAQALRWRSPCAPHQQCSSVLRCGVPF